MDKAPTFVGIDVAKYRLDIHARPAGERFTVAHDMHPPCVVCPFGSGHLCKVDRDTSACAT
jgi:hypothetical protein